MSKKPKSKRSRLRLAQRKAALENRPFDWGKFKPTDYVLKEMAKYQQTQPKTQGRADMSSVPMSQLPIGPKNQRRNQRGRRKPDPVTVAAKPFDWRSFKATDYVPHDDEHDRDKPAAAAPTARPPAATGQGSQYLDKS